MALLTSGILAVSVSDSTYRMLPVYLQRINEKWRTPVSIRLRGSRVLQIELYTGGPTGGGRMTGKLPPPNSGTRNFITFAAFSSWTKKRWQVGVFRFAFSLSNFCLQSPKLLLSGRRSEISLITSSNHSIQIILSLALVYRHRQEGQAMSVH